MNRINKRIFLRIFTLSLVLMLTFASSALTVFAASYPIHSGDVADEAGVLSESTIRQLEKTNEAIEESTGCRISICTVKDIGDTEGEDFASAALGYAREVFLDWELGEGVLILIVSDGDRQTFCLVQSAGIEDVITNEMLTSIGEDDMSADFDSGNIDRSVIRGISKLSSALISNVNTDDRTASADTEAAATESPAGSAIGRFFKKLLTFIVILLVIAVIGAIVIMFNDDAAALFSKYVLRKKPAFKMQSGQYDERLYGGQRNSGERTQAQRNPGAVNRGQYQGQRTANAQSRPANSYANGQSRTAQNGSRTSNAQARPANRQNVQNVQNRAANAQNDDFAGTRQFRPIQSQNGARNGGSNNNNYR